MRTATTIIPSFLSGLLLGTALIGAHAAREPDPYARLDEFARSLSLIETHYVEPLTTEHLLDHATRGMIDALDEHSRYLDKETYQRFLQDRDGRYFGIGVEARPTSSGMRVLRIAPGSPAQRDGLQPGDEIVAVNGTMLQGLDTETIASLLRGPRGTSVDLQIRRAPSNTPFPVTTSREPVAMSPIESSLIDGRIAYIHILTFSDDTAKTVERTLQRLLREGAAALVLDLRDNPGGSLDEAVKVVDLFVSEGTIVTTRGRRDGTIVHSATPNTVAPDLPVVILVNENSASASEVVAGALQDTERAPLVGTQTFGKGTVQTVFPTPSGAAIKLTVARYYTPSGAPVARDNGREPNHLVESVEGVPWHIAAEVRGSDDPQLHAAVRLLRP
jgi:carboxyl-terminal processing protease